MSWPGALSIVEVTTGQTVAEFDSTTSTGNPVVISGDGRLAASSDGEVVRLWSVASGEMVGELDGHTGPITSLAFDPIGSQLVSGSLDGTAVIWDLSSI